MHKKCNKCHKIKQISEFHKNPKTRDGYYTSCKSCCAEYQRKYRKKNAAKIKVNKKAYVEENRDVVLAKKRAYAKKNRQKETERAVQWQKDNPEKVNLRSKLRRFRERANGGSVTKREWNELKKMCEYSCLSCGKKVKLEMDHVVPIVSNGRGSIDNLQPLCRSCNASKGTATKDYRPQFIKEWASNIQMEKQK